MEISPFKELQSCKEYDAKSGYSYTDYFRIESFRKNVSSADDIISLQLYVLGSKDAHILLTSDDVNKTAPVYEIGMYSTPSIIQFGIIANYYFVTNTLNPKLKN